jgi:hypothetical protein
MVKEFIITEGDIDAALDLLLEVTPEQAKRRYPNLMRRYMDKTGDEDEKKIALSQMKSMRQNFPELNLPAPKSKVPATTGEKKAKTKTGEKKAKNGKSLAMADPVAAIAQAEMTPEKKKSGNYEMIVIGDKVYDRDALKGALIGAEKEAKNLPVVRRKNQLVKVTSQLGYPLTVIKKKIEDEEGKSTKPAKAKIEIHKWKQPQADGSVDWLAGFKFKGNLDKSFGALQAMFIEMFTFNRLGNGLIESGNSLTLEGKAYDKESFFEAFVLPEGEQLKILVSVLDLMAAAEDGDSDEAKKTNSDKAKKAFEELAKKLEEKKKILDTDSGLAQKFNAIKDEYLEKMYKEVKKIMGKDDTETDDAETKALQEGMLRSITIDFSEIRRKQKHLDESFLVMFGGWVKWLLEKMFGGASIPGNIKGSKSEVESFARAMGSEKRYIETAKRYGLDHPTTYKSKAKLSSATKGFEKETGIKWPFE